eukprot:sb/3463671/
MSLLSRIKMKFPQLGYCPDFFMHLGPVGPNIMKSAAKGKPIRVVVNAGGLNPDGCAKRLNELLKDLGMELNVASVSGDNLMGTGFQGPKDIKYNTMNCYLGAEPIARALDQGADIVVTGRCVDSALVLGPLIHKFGWSMDDFDKLAQGSLAGHLVECGAQCTGGNFTDWHKVPDFSNIGFPIVEVGADSTFTVTKPPKTGGLVNFGTVTEQMLYEIGDPRCYALPDVICDFTDVQVSEVGENEVEVKGARGIAPSHHYKVSATTVDGYKATTMAPMIGPRAAVKGQLNASSTIERCRKRFLANGMGDFGRVNIECLGSESNYGKDPQTSDVKEVVVWTSVEHKKKEAIQEWAKEIAGAGTGGAPGFTTLVGGLPKPAPIIRYVPFMHPKSDVKITINGEEFEGTAGISADTPVFDVPDQVQPAPQPEGSHSYRLEELAYTRSGDKGDTANLGVICRDPSLYSVIDERISAEDVRKYFSYLGPELKVTKYALPGSSSFNFLMENALGGGGIASIRSDPQGKAIGQIFTDFIVEGVKEKSEYGL